MRSRTRSTSRRSGEDAGRRVGRAVVVLALLIGIGSALAAPAAALGARHADSTHWKGHHASAAVSSATLEAASPRVARSDFFYSHAVTPVFSAPRT